jgi:GT2 family glycosyltransferase
MARSAAKDKAEAAPAVSIVIVAYQSGATLVRCLDALAAQTFTDFEVILADNASTDGAPQAALAAHPQVRFLDNGANLGFAAGVNRAAALARGRWLALINPDAYADPTWLEALLAAAEAYPEVRSFGSRQLMAADPSRLDGLGDVMSLPGFPFRGGYRSRDPGPLPVGEAFSACGGAMLIDKRLFLAMGGFEERLFCYCEDVDLGYRLRLAGEPTLVAPEAVVRHEGSAASGGARSDFAVFHGTRNRFWVFVKCTPPVLFWLSLPLHLTATAVLFARHALAGELAAPWRGLMAGFKGLPLALAMRRETQRERKRGTLEILPAMTWNPLDVLFRRVVLKPHRR